MDEMHCGDCGREYSDAPTRDDAAHDAACPDATPARRPVSHATQPIPAVAAYQRMVNLAVTTPVVVDEYRSFGGWTPSPWRKRISVSYARKLRSEGVERVGLAIAPGRVADFSIRELLTPVPGPAAQQGLSINWCRRQACVDLAMGQVSHRVGECQL